MHAYSMKNMAMAGGALVLFYTYNQLQGDAGLSITDPLVSRAEIRKDERTIGREREHNPFVRVWRGVELEARNGSVSQTATPRR